MNNILKNQKIKNLNLSKELVKKLKLAGINNLDDFNIFSLSDLKLLFPDSFEQVKKILIKYKLPSEIKNLNLTNDVLSFFKKKEIFLLDDLFLKYFSLEKQLEEEKKNNILKEIKEKLTFYQFNFSKKKKKNNKNVLEAKKNTKADFYVTEELKNDFFEDININNNYSEKTKFFKIKKKKNEFLNKTEEKQEEIEIRKKYNNESKKNVSFIENENSINVKKNIIEKKYGSQLYSYFRLSLASSEQIIKNSFGEIINYETINYRTAKPEKGGLFDERIFGPVKDYQCHCGKKQSIKKGQICPKCGIEITEAKVRRERMGHIVLGTPIVHTWYLKNTPSILANLLNIKVKTLEDIAYYLAYIITDIGNNEELQKNKILSENEYHFLSKKYDYSFVALTGGEAIKTLLQQLDLKNEITILRTALKGKDKNKNNLIKRLEILEAFYYSDNKPEWMILDVLPVLPPDLRPMVLLDGGRFATTDLNDIYRKIIARSSRLAKLKQQSAPHLIIKNEKRMLQEAVDSLIDNSKQAKSNIDHTKKLKSLSEILKGKQGRFRQNLLGKRVDYSGRSVIVVGPDLKMHQCGLPREMALILFKPFILRELRKQTSLDKKSVNLKYEEKDFDTLKALNKVIKNHPILLNRAPTLHRLGIQAFEPKIIDSKAIQLHPLVTNAFNADFDGDQMAVHVPISIEAQTEARLLMLSSYNILNPKDGKPIITLSHDIVLGNYFLTLEKENINEGKFFSSIFEIKKALNMQKINLHTRIIIKPEITGKKIKEENKNKYLITTPGKIIFNEILPQNFYFINESDNDNLKNGINSKFFVNYGTNPKDILKNLSLAKPFNKKFLSQLAARIFKFFSLAETTKILDEIKNLGFKYSTISGITFSLEDIEIYKGKDKLLQETEKNIQDIDESFENGFLTLTEKKKLTNNLWNNLKQDIQNNLIKEFKPNNNVFMMMDSGARGNISHTTQLKGMRGLMNNPQGEVIEVPVISSFREGLTVSEYFISTHGARKGATDTALKTAESGYLTRRLVDVSQDVIVSEEDCGSTKHLTVSAIIKDNKEIVSLYNRIFGRFIAEDLMFNNQIIIKKNELITHDKAEEIINLGFKEIKIRSVLTCQSHFGICQKDYGINLVNNQIIENGESVGVIAAQSIGEPGTQLTMRTFHTGGVASVSDITQGLPRIQELFEARIPKGKAVISDIDGTIIDISTTNKITNISIKDENQVINKYLLKANEKCIVEKNQIISKGQKLSSGSINVKELLKITDVLQTQNYILKEVQKVYCSQGVEVSDKHIEIIISKMFKKVLIISEGDTDLLPGKKIDIHEFRTKNEKVQGEKAISKPIILGITKAALNSNSFLSAASFQETTKVLTKAAISGQKDELLGLKENVIIGGLIPAGTGNIKMSKLNLQELIKKDE